MRQRDFHLTARRSGHWKTLPKKQSSSSTGRGRLHGTTFPITLAGIKFAPTVITSQTSSPNSTKLWKNAVHRRVVGHIAKAMAKFLVGLEKMP
jgi:hypothetical protein